MYKAHILTCSCCNFKKWRENGYSFGTATDGRWRQTVFRSRCTRKSGTTDPRVRLNGRSALFSIWTVIAIKCLWQNAPWHVFRYRLYNKCGGSGRQCTQSKTNVIPTYVITVKVSVEPFVDGVREQRLRCDAENWSVPVRDWFAHCQQSPLVVGYKLETEFFVMVVLWNQTYGLTFWIYRDCTYLHRSVRRSNSPARKRHFIFKTRWHNQVL